VDLVLPTLQLPDHRTVRLNHNDYLYFYHLHPFYLIFTFIAVKIIPLNLRVLKFLLTTFAW